MHTIGRYRFTEHDAQRTVAAHDQVWSWYAQGRDAAVLAPLAPHLGGEPAGGLEGDLARVWAAWRAAGPALRAAGQLPSTARGTVVALHRSDGGVPKQPVPSVDVGWDGVVGDRQRTRQHHGRPWQALSLWSVEAIDSLRAVGHPIAPGLAGENIALQGLSWHDVRPGVRLRIGEVLCDVDAYALPCAQNAAWFLDGDVRAMHHERGPSRVYATVLEPGRITVGDEAVLEP